MKQSSIRDWLIDSVLIVGLTGLAMFFLPWLSACFVRISLHLGRTLFWVHSTVLGDFLPHIIVGALLGVIAAWLVRHRKLSLALLPSVLFSVFCFVYFSFGAEAYHWGQVFWLDSVIVGDWLLLLIASFVCARFVLRRRQPNTALEPTPTAP
jgi:uncharacterized membrane protein YeaQ/YmgE (transglycosylase-associated protein family)